MIDYVRINGTDFLVRGFSRKNDGMHLNIRLNEDQNVDDVIKAISAGNDPLKFFNKDNTIAGEFEGYTLLDRYSVIYHFEFGIDDFGTAFQAVLTKPNVDANDITNLQLALAELAQIVTKGAGND